MNGLRLEDPWWLLLVVPVVLAGIASARLRRRRAVVYSDTSLLRQLPPTWTLRVKRLLPWLRTAGLVLLVFALSRPQQGEEAFRVRTEGIAIQMCIDRSGSMRAMDFFLDGRRVNRLDAVKSVFRDFVTGGGNLPGRPSDLIGLIDFGGYAVSHCPLTLDHVALLHVLDNVEIAQPVRARRGRGVDAQFDRLVEEELQTAIGDAVGLAIDRLRDVPAKSKVIVLLSDGNQTAGVAEPLEAAAAAKVLGIRIYTIGVGTTGLAPFPSTDFRGREVLEMQLVEFDEETLRQMARRTGGQYFSATDTEALHAVYATIDRLEKSPQEGSLYTDYRELYGLLLWPGLGLVLLEVVLTSTRFRSLP